MLGWSIHIKRNGDTVLLAISTDCSLDHQIRENAVEILDSKDYPEWGYGYPNRYHIRNAQLPRVRLYRYDQLSPEKQSRHIGREAFELGELSDIPGDTILWVELWDLS